MVNNIQNYHKELHLGAFTQTYKLTIEKTHSPSYFKFKKNMFQGRAGCVTLPDSLSMKQYPCSLFLTETNQSFINPVLRSICDFEETAYSVQYSSVRSCLRDNAR